MSGRQLSPRKLFAGTGEPPEPVQPPVPPPALRNTVFCPMEPEPSNPPTPVNSDTEQDKEIPTGIPVNSLVHPTPKRSRDEIVSNLKSRADYGNPDVYAADIRTQNEKYLFKMRKQLQPRFDTLPLDAADSSSESESVAEGCAQGPNEDDMPEHVGWCICNALECACSLCLRTSDNCLCQLLCKDLYKIQWHTDTLNCRNMTLRFHCKVCGNDGPFLMNEAGCAGQLITPYSITHLPGVLNAELWQTIAYKAAYGTRAQRYPQ